MGRSAAHVYTEPSQIQHLEALVSELPTNGHVNLELKDGSSCEGVVSERPNVQVFRDPDENEGINGVVRLERPAMPAWERFVWLDEIARVIHLDSTMGSEN
ncbi:MULTISPECIES: DUF3247 family protein [Dyella]|uniref:DUF3247 family protein n=2 Tax=Dyella TaxID=231454 RepID=A0A4R0YQK0_9GAMM|nr:MULTISPECIES: DUF3247 family protein [Dyella]TBR36786.1 DUF3247 family protein [Dyella terrae]TCI08123.1 DUF3247 family protein [Dyella soli]